MATKCIILSQGPVPSPEHTKVEGGGLRCWGLAKGLRANDADLDITVAYHESYKQESFTEHFEDINIATWNNENVRNLIAAYDTVIVSYCMGDLSLTVAESVRPDQQLVLDCYVPIYVEVSARDTNDMDREYRAFHDDVGRWSQVLARGDLFLCSSEAQKKFYRGVLSGVGRVNPATYGTDMIRVVPYGIYRQDPMPSEKPITKALPAGDKDVKKILWFGGIYPWFDLRNLVDGVHQLNKKVPTRLVIVGAKNPFNNHPDFTRPYDQLVEHIDSDPELKRLIVMQDWVDFAKRADWYLDSDLVVVINKLGEENELAWRTRLVDFMWADLPIVTNGGDPLGEELLANQAAVRLNGLSADAIADGLEGVLKNPEQLQGLRSNLSKLKQRYFWDVATKQLAGDINGHFRAPDLTQFGNLAIETATGPGGVRGKASKAITKARMVPSYARKYGMRNTYLAVRTKVGNQFRKVGAGNRTTPAIVMIAHQLDNSGAPYVFMDLARDIAGANPGLPIEFHTFNPTSNDNILELNRLGIKPRLHISKEIQIPLVPGDTVVLNTVGHATGLKLGLYSALESGVARKLVWYIHEDEPEMLFTKDEIVRVKKLLAADKIVIYIAAVKALENYQRVFGNKQNIRLQAYKFVVPAQFHKVRKADEFDKLSFILPGTVGDGRKGQLPVFYAFAAFYGKYYRANPDQYRDFELVYVGLTTDFLSRQILNHAEKLLGDRFKQYPIVSHTKSLEIMMESNVTVCYSLREVLPLSVFEGMAAGHAVLRNDSSGMEEQLFPGKNGLYLDSKDFNQVRDTIETILNKDKTTGEQLAAMSVLSNKVAREQEDHSFGPIVDEIVNDNSGHNK